MIQIFEDERVNKKSYWKKFIRAYFLLQVYIILR